MTYHLPELDYSYNALEPHIDSKTMEIHHTKHHAGYISKLNASLEGVSHQPMPIEELLTTIDSFPESIQLSLRNNGGGHANHLLFWSILSPNGGGLPSGKLSEKINESFGSYESFKTAFTEAATTRFGSGWAWLGVKDDGSLCVCSTANQDNPLMKGVGTCPCTPILGLDVWEHAYYLAYQNRRPDYINAFFNVLNWEKVTENYQNAKK